MTGVHGSSWLQLILVFSVWSVSTAADPSEIIQPSKLSTDDEINEGRPLVINCNADVVMVPAHYTTIVGVIIKRRLYGSKDFEEIVNYGINSVEVINKPEDRHWTFVSSGAPPDADPWLVRNAQLNSRAINVEWTLHDASCADAGVYKWSPPAPGVPRLSPSPHTVNNEYLEMDKVTFTCTVDGPRNSTIEWGLLKAGAHSFLPVTDGVVTEDPVVLTDTECDPRLRYKSSLLVQVTKDYDGSVFKCYGVYDHKASLSANITLSVSQDAKSVRPQNSFGKDSCSKDKGNSMSVSDLLAGLFGTILALILVATIVHFVYTRWLTKEQETCPSVELRTLPNGTGTHGDGHTQNRVSRVYDEISEAEVGKNGQQSHRPTTDTELSTNCFTTQTESRYVYIDSVNGTQPPNLQDSSEEPQDIPACVKLDRAEEPDVAGAARSVEPYVSQSKLNSDPKFSGSSTPSSQQDNLQAASIDKNMPENVAVLNGEVDKLSVSSPSRTDIESVTPADPQNQAIGLDAPDRRDKGDGDYLTVLEVDEDPVIYLELDEE